MFGNILKAIGGAVVVAVVIFFISQSRGTPPTLAQSAPLSGIQINGATNVAPGQQVLLQAEPIPSTSQIKAVTWYLGAGTFTSNPLVETAPLSTGTYLINVVATDGTITKTASISLTVGTIAPTATPGIFSGGGATATPPATETPTNTPDPTETPTAIPPTATSAPAPTATTVPAVDFDPASLKNEVMGVRPSVNDAEKANPATHKNSIGLGTEGFLAEPGVYTCVEKCSENDIKVGSLHRISPDTQYNLSASQMFGNVPEGGWGMISGNYFRMDAGDKSVTVSAGPNNSAFLFVRGLYRGDGDRNTQAKFSNFMEGHALWTRLPMGGFISQGYAEQNIMSAFNNSVNCGDTGCNRVLVRYLDLNTGATGMWWVDKDKDGNLVWSLETKNY